MLISAFPIARLIRISSLPDTTVDKPHPNTLRTFEKWATSCNPFRADEQDPGYATLPAMPNCNLAYL